MEEKALFSNLSKKDEDAFISALLDLFDEFLVSTSVEKTRELFKILKIFSEAVLNKLQQIEDQKGVL